MMNQVYFEHCFQRFSFGEGPRNGVFALSLNSIVVRAKTAAGIQLPSTCNTDVILYERACQLVKYYQK